MKRLTLFLLCATILVTIYAQDIIVTNNSERINALITEVSETEIRYKKADNPDGPIFVLPTSDISSILYRNGDVQTFAQHDNQAPQKTGVMTSTFKSVSASEDLKYIPGQQLRRMHSNCYYYGNLQMNDAVFREFIRNNCSAAYRQYKTGYNLKMTGSISIGYDPLDPAICTTMTTTTIALPTSPKDRVSAYINNTKTRLVTAAENHISHG